MHECIQQFGNVDSLINDDQEEDLGANQEDDDNGFSGGPTVPRSYVPN